MPRFPARSVALPCLLCLGTLPCLAQSTLGNEFQVNAYTMGSQRASSVSLDATGDFVVAWRSMDQDGSGAGVFARRFNAGGVAQAAEFLVNAYTTGEQSGPAVSLDADGDFVVAWSSSRDGSSYGVFGRRFNAAGIAQGLEFQVNSYTTGSQYRPSISLDADGDFVVVWNSLNQDGSDYGAFARRFNAAGIAQDVEFQVNTYTIGTQYGTSVSLDADGDFVVAWGSENQDGLGYGVFALRFNAVGDAQATEFQVNSYTTLGQQNPSVSLDAGGDFVIAWNSYTQDGSAGGVFARRFNAAGVAQSAEFQVNVHTSGQQYRPDVSVDDDGDFVVVWISSPQDGSVAGVFARRFDASGDAEAAEFQVNTYTSNSQFDPSVSFAAGRFVVAWDSPQDGSSTGTFAKRFGSLAVLDIDGNGQTTPLTDGLVVLRFLFGFTGAPLVSGAIDVVACTRCNAPAIEGYLQTLI